jgi:hypothetical protein
MAIGMIFAIIRRGYILIQLKKILAKFLGSYRKSTIERNKPVYDWIKQRKTRTGLTVDFSPAALNRTERPTLCGVINLFSRCQSPQRRR